MIQNSALHENINSSDEENLSDYSAEHADHDHVAGTSEEGEYGDEVLSCDQE